MKAYPAEEQIHSILVELLFGSVLIRLEADVVKAKEVL